MEIQGDILIVEDCEDIRDLYLINLKQDKFSGKIMATSNPEDGFNLFLKAYNDNQLPAIIILDAVFAGNHTTGYDLAQKIREYDRRRECTIVAITANSRPLDGQRVLDKKGVDAIFYKAQENWPQLWAKIKLTYEKKHEPKVMIAGQGGFLNLSGHEFARWVAILIIVGLLIGIKASLQSDVNHIAKDVSKIEQFQDETVKMVIGEAQTRQTSFGLMDAKVSKTQGTLDAMRK